MTTVVTCRGIGESLHGNMLSGLVRHLPDRWGHVEVGYSASYGPVNANRDPLGASFDRSLQDGYRKLDAILSNMRGDVVLAGYSAGAALVGNVLARKRFPNVKAAVLVADPMRPDTRMPGIAGSRPITQYQPILWVTNPRDVICCCPLDSPLRTIADQSAAMSLGDPTAWGADLLDRLRTNRWQAIRRNPFTAWARYTQALDDTAGYLGLGRPNQHTIYRTGVWLPNAANWVKGHIA